jgi:hypothetical protein
MTETERCCTTRKMRRDVVDENRFVDGGQTVKKKCVQMAEKAAQQMV